MAPSPPSPGARWSDSGAGGTSGPRVRAARSDTATGGVDGSRRRTPDAAARGCAAARTGRSGTVSIRAPVPSSPSVASPSRMGLVHHLVGSRGRGEDGGAGAMFTRAAGGARSDEDGSGRRGARVEVSEEVASRRSGRWPKAWGSPPSRTRAIRCHRHGRIGRPGVRRRRSRGRRGRHHRPRRGDDTASSCSTNSSSGTSARRRISSAFASSMVLRSASSSRSL